MEKSAISWELEPQYRAALETVGRIPYVSRQQTVVSDNSSMHRQWKILNLQALKNVMNYWKLMTGAVNG
jgi:hypothetical protein